MDAADQESGDLQFDRAEFTRQAPHDCAVCKRPIADVYYSVNGALLCQNCRAGFDAYQRVTATRILKAVLFGGGAAIVAGAGWAGIRVATGMDFGVVAIVVGLFIGVAVRNASQKTGGWPYQVIALVMTYFSISISVIPEALSHLPDKRLFTEIFAVAFCLVGGPFLVAFSGVIGAIIVAIAFYNAWRLTRRGPMQVSGPMRASPMAGPASVGAAPLPPVIPSA